MNRATDGEVLYTKKWWRPIIWNTHSKNHSSKSAARNKPLRLAAKTSLWELDNLAQVETSLYPEKMERVGATTGWSPHKETDLELDAEEEKLKMAGIATDLPGCTNM